MEKTLDNNQVLNKEVNQRSVEAKQEGGKFTTVAQELGKTLDDYVRFTFSSEEFKKALEGKFGGNINQFNQNLVLFALTLKHMEKAAEGDEELKKLLPSLQEKMKAVNENIGKIAKELGYTVSQYPLDKFEHKNFKEIKEMLKNDFRVEPKFETLFSQEALNILEYLFDRFYPSRVNAPVATVPIISETEDKEVNKEKSATFTQQTITGATVPTFTQQTVLQTVSKEQSEGEQNKAYHSHLRETDKKTIAGVVLSILGGALFVGSFVYLPVALGLLGIGLATLGFFLVPLPSIKKKSAEGESTLTQPVVQQQQLAGQQVFKQQSEEKEYHSNLRETGKKIAIAGAVGIIGGVLFAWGSLFYLPLAAFGLAGIGLVALGSSLAVVGGVTWLAGKISEKIHNRHISNEEKRKKEEEKRKKEEEKKKKEEERAKAIHPYW